MRDSTFNTALLLKAINRFTVIPINILMVTFTDIEKLIPSSYGLQDLLIAKKILKKKRKSWMTFSDFKTYYKTIVIKQCGIDKRTDV